MEYAVIKEQNKKHDKKAGKGHTKSGGSIKKRI